MTEQENNHPGFLEELKQIQVFKTHERKTFTNGKVILTQN